MGLHAKVGRHSCQDNLVDATLAQLNAPKAIAVSGSKFYISDTTNYRVRVVRGRPRIIRWREVDPYR